MERIEYNETNIWDKVFESQVFSHSSDSKPNKVLMIKSSINILNNEIRSSFVVKSAQNIIYDGPVLEIAIAYYNNI